MKMAGPALGPPRETMWGMRGNRHLLAKTWRAVGPLQTQGRPAVSVTDIPVGRGWSGVWSKAREG